MADALLTTLCGICRAVPPRYKCPRCGARYCSVECNRRHKARTSCSGIRDVTAFVSSAQLRTPAGLDHDYNFLHGIELARLRTQKEIVEERRLLRRQELRPVVVGERDPDAPPTRVGAQRKLPVNSVVLEKQWKGDGELRFMPVEPRGARNSTSKGGADANNDSNNGLSRKLRSICRRLDIDVVSVPHGLSRHRENTTTAVGGGGGATATKTAEAAITVVTEAQEQQKPLIHWQVEWLVYEQGPDAKPTRSLWPTVDNVPLQQAYTALMDWILQKPDGSRLVRVLQEGEREKSNGSAPALATDKDDCPTFYLLKPRLLNHGSEAPVSQTTATTPTADRSILRKELIHLAATDTLQTALVGRTLLEFPTIYVLSSHMPREEGDEDMKGRDKVHLPKGHTLGSTAWRNVPKEEETATESTVKNRRGQLNRRGDKLQMAAASAEGATVATESAPVEATGQQDEHFDTESETLALSETSSEGEDSDESESTEGEEEDEEDGEIVDEQHPDEDTTLPLLTAIHSKSRLVVYDSWSEGSGHESE